MTTAVLQRYWQRTRRTTVLLVIGWLLLTVAAGWFAPMLTMPLSGWPSLGYWLLAQGAVLGYLALTVLYAVVMNRRDARQQVPADPE